jgi:UTP--glucose-1-phosphate uridylyltransferase
MITKVVIPAAGLGTRFLPFTKSVPKELLPIYNKPAIHWILEELAQCGLTDLTMIIHDRKKSLREYLESNSSVFQQVKNNELDQLEELIKKFCITFINQEQPLGLGHAIYLAKETIGNNYFSIILPDDLIIAETPMLIAMMELAQKHNALVLAVEEVPDERVSSYGIVSVQKYMPHNTYKLNNVIEKPQLQNAPSGLGIVGRYVCPPEIFDALEKVKPTTSSEWQLTDAIQDLLKQGFPVLAYKVMGSRFDLGTPAGWLQANNKIYTTINNY